MGQYDYRNLKGSYQKKQDEEEAKNGLLPEGTYKFALGMASKEAEQTSKATVWVFKCKIIKPGTIYHQVERQLRYSTASHFYARERMGQLIEFMDILGINWDWIKILSDNDPDDTDGEKAMLSVLSYVADQKLRLDVQVSNQEDKDGKVSKYQSFIINTDTVQPLNWEPFLTENGIGGSEVDADAGEEVGEEAADEEVAPPPPPPVAPVKNRNPFAKKA